MYLFTYKPYMSFHRFQLTSSKEVSHDVHARHKRPFNYFQWLRNLHKDKHSHFFAAYGSAQLARTAYLIEKLNVPIFSCMNLLYVCTPPHPHQWTRKCLWREHGSISQLQAGTSTQRSVLLLHPHSWGRLAYPSQSMSGPARPRLRLKFGLGKIGKVSPSDDWITVIILNLF